MEKAFVLHARLYRDTSLLVEFFTQSLGRVSAIARGARSLKSPWRGVLQPFNLLTIDVVGKHELQTLRQAELVGPCHLLKGDALFCGFYLNELLMRLLIRHDPYPVLFHDYVNILLDLQKHDPQKILRVFEKKLLSHLGYGLSCSQDYRTHQPIQPDAWYCYESEYGVTQTTSDEPQSTGPIFSGQSLLDFERETWGDEQSLHDAKRLIRLALAPRLGAKPLKSRELFQQK